MESVAKVVPAENTVYVSLEAHMACGIGACLGCTCETRSGNKKSLQRRPGVLTRRGVLCLTIWKQNLMTSSLKPGHPGIRNLWLWPRI